MFKARCAEYLLRGFVRREQAEEIVGDLLETYGRSSRVNFWFALLRVIVRFAWRPTTAVLVALAVFILSEFKLTTVAARRFGFGASKDVPLLFRSIWFASQSASLWALAAFAFLRYGLRDRSFWWGSLYAALCTFYVYSFWMPSIRIEFYVCCAVAALVSLSVSVLRRSTLVVAVSLVACIATRQVLSSLFYVLFSLPISRRHLIGHVWIAASATEVLPLVVAALTFGLLHRQLVVADPAVA
jgi:hypothetical protein